MRSRQAGTGRARQWPGRWLLPLVLAVAVLAMHGLGHPSGHCGRMTGMTASPAHPAAHPGAAPLTATSTPAMSAEGSGPAQPGGLDPVSVCLAMLAGTFVLLMLLRGGRLVTGPAGDGARARMAIATAGRSPPVLTPSLHALQVFRL